MQQTLITVGAKSQVVIPKDVRKIVTQIKPGKKVMVRPLSSRAVIVEAPMTDWVNETYRMHKKVWEGIDATEYIQTLRREWELKK